jgi:hypothetical protein
MTSMHTLPTPVLTPIGSHEHAWLVESRHSTSDGILLYVRCAECGIRRMDLQPHSPLPPVALSRTVGGEELRP